MRTVGTMVDRLLTRWLVDESPYLRRIREEGSLTRTA